MFGELSKGPQKTRRKSADRGGGCGGGDGPPLGTDGELASLCCYLSHCSQDIFSQ